MKIKMLSFGAVIAILLSGCADLNLPQPNNSIKETNTDNCRRNQFTGELICNHTVDTNDLIENIENKK